MMMMDPGTPVTMRCLFLTLVIFHFSVTTAEAGILDFLFGSDYKYNVLFYSPSGKEEFLGNILVRSFYGFRQEDGDIFGSCKFLYVSFIKSERMSIKFGLVE